MPVAPLKCSEILAVKATLQSEDKQSIHSLTHSLTHSREPAFYDNETTPFTVVENYFYKPWLPDKLFDS